MQSSVSEQYSTHSCIVLMPEFKVSDRPVLLEQTFSVRISKSQSNLQPHPEQSHDQSSRVEHHIFEPAASQFAMMASQDSVKQPDESQSEAGVAGQ